MTIASTVIIMNTEISDSSNAAPVVIICVKEIDNMDEQECPDIYKKIYEKAKRQGRMYCYLTCVREGYMPLAYALQESGLAEAEFMRAMTNTTIKEERLRVLETLIQKKIITDEDAVEMFDITFRELHAWENWHKWFIE